MRKLNIKISENLSSDTLFHFTAKRQYLTSILRDKFRPRYCLEDLTNFNFDDFLRENDVPFEFAIPMVCFCDIPLSKTKAHLSKYGYYGIGLKKKWGIANGISPILYSEKDSRTAKLIRQMFKELIFTKKGAHKTVDNAQELIIDILRYTKPYQGKMWRINRYVEGIRFYDEREWRFVPDTNADKLMPFITKADFLKAELKAKHNQKLHDLYSIAFTTEDINYIILKNENELDKFFKDLVNLKLPDFDTKTINRLMSKVITSEKIFNDL